MLDGKCKQNCFQEHPEAICYLTCCEHFTLFHRCFLKIYVHCSDGEGLDSLRLFTCQLSPAVNGNIYFILEYDLNTKVYSLHFLLIYI